MDESPDNEARRPAPADWQGWERWTEGVDWSDWRSWLRRLAATDWAAAGPGEVPWETPAAGSTALTLSAYQEDFPGPRMREQLAGIWPAFHRWWSQGGVHARPTTAEARARLEEHMPQLVGTWEQLAGMLPGDSDAGPALSLWNPPPFLTGCSQAVVLGGGPALVRNYDWDHRLFDGVVSRTAYTGRRVLGMADCLWGLLDGVNDAGLAVSLTFGGRREVGEGFGIPIVVRYVLEVCQTVDEAVRVLSRIPVHMSYNITALDRAGRFATVYVAPDRPAQVTDRAVTTNHQGKVEWAPYVAAVRSVEREQQLEALLDNSADVTDVVAACLRDPLYATHWDRGFGTLYTAEYRPADGIVRYHWPHRTWEHSLHRPNTGSIQLHLGTDRPTVTERRAGAGGQ